MTKTIRFTAPRVAGIECERGKPATIWWDAKTPGLGLKVTAAGARKFVFDGRIGGKTLRITIGDPRTWTLDQAQGESRRLRTLIDRRLDPRQQRAELDAAAQAAALERTRLSAKVGDAWAAYLVEVGRKKTAKYHADHLALAAPGGEPRTRSKQLTVRGPLADLMPLLLADLTPDRIAGWLEREAVTRPTSAAYAYRVLRAFIRWCEGRAEFAGAVPAGAYRARAVRDALPKPRTKDDVLQREMLQPWFDGVRRIKNPTIRSYLQALLLTGSRRGELADLKWADVDLEWRSLRIRDKVEGQRTIPLTPYVASLLRGLKVANETPPKVAVLRHRKRIEASGWKPSPWVFSSGGSDDGKLAEPRIAHNRALDAAGLPHLTLHGLRRSFSTLSEWVEVPVGIVAQIMGHKPSATAERHYKRRPLDLLRQWHDKIESWILIEAGVERPVVTQLGPKAIAAKQAA